MSLSIAQAHCYNADGTSVQVDYHNPFFFCGRHFHSWSSSARIRHIINSHSISKLRDMPYLITLTIGKKCPRADLRPVVVLKEVPSHTNHFHSSFLRRI